MNIKTSYICLIILLSLNLSCVENKKPQKVNNFYKITKNSNVDTLKFTSGISAIFQDSKRNYWFGSLKEGVAVYDGTSFKYFTMKDGLSDNQIHSIQEDKNGVVWFDTQIGISSYDGKIIKNRIPVENKSTQYLETISENNVTQNNWKKLINDLWFEAGKKKVFIDMMDKS